MEYLAKALVDEPEQVNVTEVEGERVTVIELRVAQTDLGKVIGKQGRTARFFILVAFALRMVLSARAVRPCLPMTLPRSVWATRSSITVTRSPSTSVTFTCSGSSTSAFATYSTSSLNHDSHCSCVRQLLCVRYAPGFGANAISFFTVLEACAPLAIHAFAFSRSIVTCGGFVTGL